VKRVQLFEFEDLPWFPAWIRNCMTRYIAVVHQWVGTREALTPLIRRLIEMTPSKKLIDLCSGSGGPLPEVARALQAEGLDFELTMSDLYLNLDAAHRLATSGIQYKDTSADAKNVPYDGAWNGRCPYRVGGPALRSGFIAGSRKAERLSSYAPVA
jgi:hypothetical protein